MHNGNQFSVRGVAHLEGVLPGFAIHRPPDAPCVVVLLVKAIQEFVCSLEASKRSVNYFVFHFVSCSAFTRSRVKLVPVLVPVFQLSSLALRERAVKP